MSAPKTNQQKADWKALCVEVNHPYESRQWKFLWQLDEDERANTQSLIHDLNKINAPVQLRLVPNEHKE